MKRLFPTSFSAIGNDSQSWNYWRSHPDPIKDMEEASKSLAKRGYDKGERERILRKELGEKI